ncbi:putative chromatin regulator PHD family [Helianthus debilis subsp. tardiflorus]
METPDEVLVCQTCGAEGLTNAFIYCVKCLKYVIHRYCLAVMPETFDEFVTWYCEDCEQPVPYHFTPPPEHDPSPSHNDDPPNSALVKKTTPLKKKQKKKKSLKKRKLASLVEKEDDKCVSRRNKFTQDVVLGLVKRDRKSLPVQKTVAASLPDVQTKDEDPLLAKNEVSCPPETAKSNDQKCAETLSNSLLKEASANSDRKYAELDNGFSTKGIVKRKRDTTRVAAKTKKQKIEKSSEHSSCESSCTDATLKNEKDVTHTEEELKCGPDNDKMVSNSSSIENQLNTRSNEFIGSAYASQSDYMQNNMQCIKNQPARPWQDPIWRGSFNITQTDYDLFEGLVGHLSTRACKKVIDEATTLSSMLSLEMHPKADLWPKSFSHSPPSDGSIALYFFPHHRKNERDFEQLVDDMIDKDLAMKASAKNAEMLIFTSKVLPQPFWRFQGNYYLWGVFRGKKNDVPVANHSDNHVLSANSGNEVTSEKEDCKRVKTIESRSPQSPLCNYR